MNQHVWLLGSGGPNDPPMADRGGPICWLPYHDVFVNLPTVEDYLAYDGRHMVGRVFRIEEGPNTGRWFWAMLATPSGLGATSDVWGIEGARDDAEGCVVEAYQQLIGSLARAQFQ